MLAQYSAGSAVKGAGWMRDARSDASGSVCVETCMNRLHYPKYNPNITPIQPLYNPNIL